MATMSYLSVIERYHEYRVALREILASILNGIADPVLLGDAAGLQSTMRCIIERYPFADMLYSLDANGIQNSPNCTGFSRHPGNGKGEGKDRSQRPYFRLAQDGDDVVITEPYLSNSQGLLCITAIVRQIHMADKKSGYIVLDIDLSQAISFLMGDAARRKFVPLFRSIYVIITVALFCVVGILLYTAFFEIGVLLIGGTDRQFHLKPFSVIIFATLALAVFDLGRTILEEEVLMHKDIYRHSSTRRTITRFMAAILIAVSIEALLLMFRSALSDGNGVIQAVWLMLAAVGLLIGLGLYVFLGARAEALLLSIRK